MRGAFVRYFLRIVLIFGLLLAPLASFKPSTASAVGTLEFPQDVLTSTTPGRADIQHDISFVLPVDASQITPSDWVLIQLTNFTFVTAPTEIVGAFGNASLSVVGNTLRVTNIALLPGTRLQILGATAQNPQPSQSFEVIMKVVAGAANGIVRNQATTFAGEPGSYVSVSAIIESPLSAINLSGFTSPGAFVTITENGTAIGTTSAAGDGSFNFPVSGLDPGDHTYRIGASDNENRNTSQAVVQLFLISGTVTTASGILLSPTIELDKSELLPGATLTASGSAKPSSSIDIFVESPLKSYSTTTDVNGNWSYTLAGSETTNYPVGQYRIYATVRDAIGNQSLISPTLNFDVTADEDDPNPPPDCDISHGDLNCDTRTNLTDFSILLFHWKTNHKKADINGDGSVNLVDFSIMMFYFRR